MSPVSSSRRTHAPAHTILASLVLAVVGLALSACSQPAEKLAEHFEEMALVAEKHADDCPGMGNELQDYLDRHGEEMTGLMGQMGESSREQAQRVDVASQRIDKVVEPCRGDAGVDGFAMDLSRIVLGATGLAGE